MKDSGYTFGLCLSHDVDRVYKSYQYLYEALIEKQPQKALGLLSSNNPWWQFERIMDLEASFDVRSSFNILAEDRFSERPIREQLSKDGVQLYAGRYDVLNPQLKSTFKILDRHGWEISLQGSFNSSVEPERFAAEKERIELASGTEVNGNRQHHWRLEPPNTWQHLRDVGVKYDTSLGDSHTVSPPRDIGEVIRPFGDEFVVFPWTLMDGAVMGAGEYRDCIDSAKQVLEQARDSRGVIVADWHQRVFHEPDFPGWARAYREIIEMALDMGAWVGPPRKFYDALSHPDGSVDGALKTLAE
ncbi:hypothetical protein [Natronococcus jeotgali]|uniref:hypothetical protein n=1 Tax=Natronococcus jeotgali TaxID=413812 RepID=UPI0012690593|nr:hypothetical protein [Natronococcus jeotgali]